MRIPDLNIDLVRNFVVVAESGSFTAAGDVLGRTQSAVSQKVKRLEDLLGKPVLRRTTRSISLTAEGELLLPAARKMLSLNDETVQSILNNELREVLRIGFADHFSAQHLSTIVSNIHASHPKVVFQLKLGLSGDLRSLLDEGSLDLVVARSEPQNNRGLFLWQEDVVWVAHREMKLSQGEPVPLSLPNTDCDCSHQAISELRTLGKQWRVVATSDSLDGQLAAVKAGAAIALVGATMVAPWMRILGSEDGLRPLASADLALFGAELTTTLAAHAGVRHIQAYAQRHHDKSNVAPCLRALST